MYSQGGFGWLGPHMCPIGNWKGMRPVHLCDGMQLKVCPRLCGGAPETPPSQRVHAEYGPVPLGWHVRQVLLPDPETTVSTVIPDR
eukprot:1167117-Prorocentrum_lima.AAC.1